jgi:hypothetical protein
VLPPLAQVKGASFPGLLKQLPQHKPWMITISVISVLVVLGACGFGSYQLFKEGDQPVGVIASGPAVQRRDITTRQADPNPLTVEMVFPSREIAPAEDGLPPYVMVGDPQAMENCQYAATFDIKTLLAGTDDGGQVICSQFVWASFISYDERYLVTVGVLNLPDMQRAAAIANEIKSAGENGQGTLIGYVSDPSVAQLTRAAPHLSMVVHGHFLLYAVIVHKDGSDMGDAEQGAQVVAYDLLQHYLRDQVLDAWSVETGPPVQEPTTDPTS